MEEKSDYELGDNVSILCNSGRSKPAPELKWYINDQLVSGVPGFLPDDRHTASLVGHRGGWRHARTKLCFTLMVSMLLCPGKGLVLPTTTIDTIATHCRFLFLSLPNNEMSWKSPFAIQKALTGIGGEPKSMKNLRSGHLLIEIKSVSQSKSFLLARNFLDPPLTVCPHKYLNYCRGVISETDLLCASEAEILEGLEARKLIVPQSSQTYAQVTKPTAISTTTQTDPSITKIICPLLQCLSPVLSTSSSMPAVSTSSSTEAHLRPSTSAIIPTIQSESQLPMSIPATTTFSGNSLNTSASSLETETRLLTISNKFAALSTEIQPLVPLLESVSTASSSEHSNAPEISKYVKRNSRSRRKGPKVRKPEIEIKMAPHRPRKSAPTEYATDEEDRITYNVEEDELEPNPADKFVMGQCWRNNLDQYLRADTPTRF
ncbi:uncharacterized protein TNCV_3873771 [Trichonephila clavipes]|nr:uncharacterized protein TNCV_3873771 [Trichonephila clavipes]